MNMGFEEQILAAARRVLGAGDKPLHAPRFDGRERELLAACIDDSFVSSVGPMTGRFERQLAEFVGVRHVVAVVNGTSALHLALKLAGVGVDDEVLMPALTFVATANAVAYCGAHPHFIDSEPRTLGLDAQCLEARLEELAERREGGLFNRRSGRRIAAVVPVHIFGHPVELDELSRVCRAYGLPMVEDACESLGSRYHGRPAGGDGLLAALSFNGNKIMTTGGGGAVLTNDPELAARARHLATTARVAHAYEFEHDQIGFNYRMPALNAALGVAQLERLARVVEEKRALAARYIEAFSAVAGVSVLEEPAHARSNYWLNTLLLDDDRIERRDRVLSVLNEDGIQARPLWRLMSELPMYRDAPRQPLPVATRIQRRVINLPSGPGL